MSARGGTKKDLLHVIRGLETKLAEAEERIRKMETEASETVRYLECMKCETQFEAEEGKNYENGVMCPECKERGYTLVGICHLHEYPKRITVDQWEQVKLDLKLAEQEVKDAQKQLEMYLNELALPTFTCAECGGSGRLNFRTIVVNTPEGVKYELKCICGSTDVKNSPREAFQAFRERFGKEQPR